MLGCIGVHSIDMTILDFPWGLRHNHEFEQPFDKLLKARDLRIFAKSLAEKSKKQQSFVVTFLHESQLKTWSQLLRSNGFKHQKQVRPWL